MVSQPALGFNGSPPTLLAASIAIAQTDVGERLPFALLLASATGFAPRTTVSGLTSPAFSPKLRSSRSLKRVRGLAGGCAAPALAPARRRAVSTQGRDGRQGPLVAAPLRGLARRHVRWVPRRRGADGDEGRHGDAARADGRHALRCRPRR